MQHVFRLFIAGFFSVIFLSSAFAQTKELQLSEKQVLGFLTAHKEMMSLGDAQSPGVPDQKTRSALEATARKHGFANFDDYDQVTWTITLVLMGVDPITKKYTNPAIPIRKEIERVLDDKEMPEQEKKEMLAMLAQDLQHAQAVKYPTNIELVLKHLDKINEVMQ